MKQIVAVHDSPPAHWVGDGFPVRSVFHYGELGQPLSPFLLFDHAAPHAFAPADTQRGVGTHPHRGFETVSLVYQGALEHHDSAGNSGKLGPGDVQWMTAGAGILHQEYHAADFTRAGGTLEMAQLWVNLPARHKLTAPNYQDLRDAQFPRIALAPGATLRLIAGEYAGQRGPAHTFSPVELWDLWLEPRALAELSLPEGHTAALVVLRGEVSVNAQATARSGQLLRLSREGSRFSVSANEQALVLILGGEPLNEPIAGYGPFVMNTQAEIRQALQDFQSGQFGQI